MKGGFLPLILLAIFGIPSCVVSQSSQLETCRQLFRCGDEDISYPFYGAGRPTSCGAVGYQINCTDNVPRINTSSLIYRVLEINYQTRTLRVARDDLWSDLCPQTQQLANTSLDTTLFRFVQPSTDQDITLLYGCTVPPSTPRLPTQFGCSDNAAFYLVTPEQTSSITCAAGLRVTARVTQSAASSLGSNLNPDLSTDLLRTSLQGGFSIQWALNNQTCQGCLDSGGACGSDVSSGSFVCHCANNASFPSTCSDGNN